MFVLCFSQSEKVKDKNSITKLMLLVADVFPVFPNVLKSVHKHEMVKLLK